jgi:hypothetical protein
MAAPSLLASVSEPTITIGSWALASRSEKGCWPSTSSFKVFAEFPR